MSQRDFVYEPPAEGPDILYKGDGFLVVCKPSGLLSVPGRSEAHKDSLIERLKPDYPTINAVHRLDMSTSGLMIVAFCPDVHRALSKQFEQRKVGKRYQAVLSGIMGEVGEEGAVEVPLICDWPNRPKQIVDKEQGKPSTTRYKVVAHEGHTTRVLLYPITGRSHQLRVHMQHLGYPIEGDQLYNECAQYGERLKLHAEYLKFNNPSASESNDLVFEDACPF